MKYRKLTHPSAPVFHLTQSQFDDSRATYQGASPPRELTPEEVTALNLPSWEEYSKQERTRKR
jgi:hypothetical protein